MIWSTAVLGVVAGLLTAVVTAPVGVSGAVFLLPVQLSLSAKQCARGQRGGILTTRMP